MKYDPLGNLTVILRPEACRGCSTQDTDDDQCRYHRRAAHDEGASLAWSDAEIEGVNVFQPTLTDRNAEPASPKNARSSS